MMMRRILNIAVSLALALAAVSCVFDNDMSYPRLKGEITAFAVEGQKEVTINPDSLTVDVLLEETAEIDSLRITEYQLSEMAVADTLLGEYIDLSEPVQVMLSTYPGRDYLWTISASQPIERFVKCSGLIDAVFDVKNQTVMVAVAEAQPLDEIVITDMKIMQETSKILTTTGYDAAQSGVVTTDVKFPMTLDCTLSRQFTVLYQGVEYVWTVTFVQQKIQNQVKSVDAWAYHAVVTGDFDGVGTPYYEYKTSSDTEWTVFDQVEVNGVSVKADITSLTEATEYQVRLVSENAVGDEYVFKTETAAQLTGMGFNEWYFGGTNGKTWYPFAEGDQKPNWDTANPGVSSLIENTTVPEYDHKVEGDAAAKMISALAMVKFAAGNIFTGRFVEFKDWKASLEWGVPFESRPYSLKGWYDYSPALIDRDEMRQFPDLLGKPDIMQIMVSLVADGEAGPFDVISSEPGKPDLQNDPRVIAFGEILASENTGGKYVEFELPLTYKEGDARKPAYVIIVACASYRGNYFTGGIGSTLYVDGFEFTYR